MVILLLYYIIIAIISTDIQYNNLLALTVMMNSWLAEPRALEAVQEYVPSSCAVAFDI